MQPWCKKFRLSGPVLLDSVTKIYGETMTQNQNKNCTSNYSYAEAEGEVKKQTCLASPPASFFEAACFFLFFFYLKKLLKKTRKIWSFSKFFFFFSEEKIACYTYRKIAFYIFRLPHQLFHLLWKLSRMSGGHLEKIGRPVVLENVSGGHFEKNPKQTPPPSFFPQRQDAKHVFFNFA